MEPDSQRLRQYFEKRYPLRGGTLWAPLFRQGESLRLQRLKSWVPNWEKLEVLDAGCGDGAFLKNLLQGRPARLRLEDIVESWTDMARERLLDCADSIETATIDVRDTDDSSTYDVVLALGVFDYSADWPGLMASLLRRCRGMLLVDFPKSGTWHSVLRRNWLRLQGVTLHSARREELDTLMTHVGVTAHIEDLPIQWIARIKTAG